MESEKPCSRKELRELEKSLSRQQKTNFKLSRSLTRVALVGALASLTVVASVNPCSPRLATRRTGVALTPTCMPFRLRALESSKPLN